MARFNKEAFLQAEYTDALDTERTLFPQGECVAEYIEDFQILEPQSFTDRETGEQREGSPRINITFAIREDHAQRIREELGYAADRPVRFTWRGYLDITEDGYLDFGPNKNLMLGQIRSAVGQNEPGQAWNFTMLKGARGEGSGIAFTVKHEEWERDGKKGTTEKVSRFATAEDDA